MPAKGVDETIGKEYRRHQNDLYLECFNDAKRILRKAGGDFPVERALDVADTLFQKRCPEWIAYRNEARAEHARAERHAAPTAQR